MYLWDSFTFIIRSSSITDFMTYFSFLILKKTGKKEVKLKVSPRVSLLKCQANGTDCKVIPVNFRRHFSGIIKKSEIFARWILGSKCDCVIFLCTLLLSL